ncbi:MOSC domain-containing protein [Kribbella speibonae]|uniref:MOSC domain-containing protein n=2 Tax=Kribbella speibonae TaxID=1572660 RepID=A0A4R0IG87_9ACTN|nr:MOSC domain-containing protein [Kribbella speibonae]
MGKLLSLNIADPRSPKQTNARRTAIGKRPVAHRLAVTPPAPRGAPGSSGSGLAGDWTADLRNHGGPDQAICAYGREDLDLWQRQLGRTLPNGSFGENLTIEGLAVSDALIGERWRIGDLLVLEISATRMPCRGFAEWIGEAEWVKRFTHQGLPGAYLRVITPGEITAGDRIEVIHRPTHGITSAVAFRALTGDRDLLPRLIDLPSLSERQRQKAEKLSSPCR